MPNRRAMCGILQSTSHIYYLQNEYARGGSCIVYAGYYLDENENKHAVLVKELYPRKLEITRDDCTNELLIPTEKTENFGRAVTRFDEGYNLQVGIHNSSGLVNKTSDAYEIFSANNTRYIVMATDEGVSYSDHPDETLADILEVGLSVAKAMVEYHKLGYLHLDIKAENVFLMAEGTHSIKLFDFDTVTPIVNGVCTPENIYYTRGCTAPEQEPDFEGRYYRKRLIDCRSDFYAIGSMILKKINQNHLLPIKDGSEIDVKRAIVTENPQLIQRLDGFLRRTKCQFIEKRYQTGAELICALEELVELANQKLFLVSNFPHHNIDCVGREDYLEEIHQVFQHQDNIVLRFLGGIGKTTLAKKYAYMHRDDYDTILFLPYRSDVMDLILSESVHIGGQALDAWNDHQEKAVQYRRKLVLLRELLQKNKNRTLLIVDALDVLDAPNRIEELLTLPCKLLISTRNHFQSYDVHSIVVDKLAREEDAYSLFCKHYRQKITDEQRNMIMQVIRLVDHHTLTIVLLAKSLYTGGDVDKKLRELLEHGQLNYATNRIKLQKDGQEYNESIDKILQSIFDISQLNLTEKKILKNLSLFSVEGINRDDFKKWIRLKDYENIDSLEKKGWVYRTEDNLIYLHQVVSDVMFKKLKPTPSSCTALFECLVEQVSHTPQNANAYDSVLHRFLFVRERFSTMPSLQKHRKHPLFQQYQMKVGILKVSFSDLIGAQKDFREIVTQQVSLGYVQQAKCQLFALALNFEEYDEASHLLDEIESVGLEWADEYYALHLLQYKGWYALNTDSDTNHGQMQCIACQREVIALAKASETNSADMRRILLSAQYSLAVAYYRRAQAQPLPQRKNSDCEKALAVVQNCVDRYGEFQPLLFRVRNLEAECYVAMGDLYRSYQLHHTLLNDKLEYYHHTPNRTLTLSYRNFLKVQTLWLLQHDKKEKHAHVAYQDVMVTIDTLRQFARAIDAYDVLVFACDMEYQLACYSENLMQAYESLIQGLEIIVQYSVTANTRYLLAHCDEWREQSASHMIFSDMYRNKLSTLLQQAKKI